MTEDIKQDVQPGGASTEGATPPAGVQPPAEPSAEEKMNALIQQKVNEAITQATEIAKRELQSVKDKARSEVESAQRRMKLAESTLGTVRQRTQELDPDVAKELELSELRAREANRTTLEQEEAQRRQQEAFGASLRDSLNAHLEALGIDLKDKRIDWAADTSDYIQGRSRFDASVDKIVKEEKQTMQTSLEKRLIDLEAKISQVSTEANSVTTTTSPGVVAGSDTEFIQKFASGELSMTKANVDRYQKIRDSY